MIDVLQEEREFAFDLHLSLEHSRVKQYLKFGNLEALKDRVKKALEIANKMIKPRGLYRIGSNEELQISRHNPPGPLRETNYYALNVATVGKEITDAADELINEGDYTTGNIVDSLGSAAVNMASDRLIDKMMNEAGSIGLKSTRAFSPGSGSVDWKVNNQRFIFDNLNTDKIGVKLTPSFTMLPKKSNSFVIGLDKDIKQVENFFSCAGCPRADCPARYIPEK